MPQTYPDGTTAGGGKFVMRGGQWYPVNSGPTVAGSPDPTQPYKVPRAAADTARAQAEADPVRTAAETRKAVADADKAQTEAAKARSENDDLSPDFMASLKAGKPIRLQDLSPGDRGIVSGLLQGNLPAGARSIASKSMLPYIKMAMSVDPSFNANVFASRGALLKDYVSGDTSKNITALRTAIGHLGHLQTQISGTFSGPVVPLNALGNSFEKNILGASGPGLFDQTTGHVAEEATKVFRPQGGAESDVQRNLKDLTSSASSSQKNDNIQNLLALFKSRLEALDTKFKQGMGAGGADFQIIDPTTQQTINQISGIAPPSGPGGPGSGGGNGPAGGSPFVGGAGQNVIGAGMNAVPNPAGKAILDQEQSLLTNKAPDDRIRAWAANVYGTVPPHIEQMLKARAAGIPIALNPGEGLLTRNVPADAGLMGKLGDAAATNPWMVGIGEAGNAAAGGLPQAVARGLSSNPDMTDLRFNTAREAHGSASAIGQLAGGALGSLGAEGLAAKGLSKLPFLFKGLGAADRAAAIAPWAARLGDAGYGGVSGATSDPENPLGGGGGGALLGLGGGMAGRTVTRGIGKTLSGVTNGSVGYLDRAGVPLTLGQSVANSGIVGKAIKGTEDAMTSLPIVGDVLAYARNRGIKKFNGAAFKEGLAPITKDIPPTIREQGVEMGLGKVGDAFDSALDGQNVTIPLGRGDPFMAAVRAGAGSKTGGDQFIDVLDRNIAPIANKGTITGRDFQQLDRSTDGYARKFDMLANGTPMTPPQPGFEPVASAFGDMNAALTDAVRTSNPGMLPQYEAAKGAYRNTMVLRDAVNRARNGTRSGDAGVFMPSQLSDAAGANSRIFGGTQGTTNQPFFDLTRAGQDVLPSKMADSGTAKRLMINAPLLAAGGGAYASGNETAQDTAGGTAVTMAMLAAALSPPGQRLLRTAVLNRPDFLRKLGTNTLNNAAPYGGIFGAPVALQLQGK